jgi:hypothetical protein
MNSGSELFEWPSSALTREAPAFFRDRCDAIRKMLRSALSRAHAGRTMRRTEQPSSASSSIIATSFGKTDRFQQESRWYLEEVLATA